MPVYKDKKRNSWYFEFKKTIDGITYRNKKRGFQSKTEALIEEQKAINNIKNPTDTILNYTLDEFFEIYQDYRKTKIKITTVSGDSQKYNVHISPTFGSSSLVDLTPNKILDWKKALISKNMTERFTNQIIGVFKGVIQYAIRIGVITDNKLLNELERVHMNQIIKERDVWSLEQINQFLDVFAKDDPTEYEYWLYFYAYANSGMRPNEFRALQVKDIQGDYLVVNKSINSKLGKEDLIQPPKNVNSNRKVLMPHEIIVLLQDHVKGYNPTDFIFGKDRAFRETNILRRLKTHAKVANLQPIVLYGFRHSHATNLIKAGVPIKVVSKRLGHKDASTTMNVYWHLFQEDESQVLDVLTKKC